MDFWREGHIGNEGVWLVKVLNPIGPSSTSSDNCHSIQAYSQVLSLPLSPSLFLSLSLSLLIFFLVLHPAKPEEVPADFRLRGVISGDASERYQSAVSMLNNLFTFTEFRCGSAPDLKRHRRDAQCNSRFTDPNMQIPKTERCTYREKADEKMKVLHSLHRLEEIEKHARIMTNRRLATMEVLDSQYDSFAQVLHSKWMNEKKKKKGQNGGSVSKNEQG